MPPSWSSRSSNHLRILSGDLEQALAAEGLDLVQAFDVQQYNRLITGHATLQPVPMFGRRHTLAYAVGNSKALWPVFVASYRRREDLHAHSDPLDQYVHERVMHCAATIDSTHEIYFAHEGGARLVSMVHLAEASALGQRSPVGLAIHPEHGPWFGMRALIVVDAPPPSSSPEPIATCTGCPAPCRAAYDHALVSITEHELATGDLETSWRAWVAVRDACPVGRQSRYGEAQIRYHYTKDRAALMADEER